MGLGFGSIVVDGQRLPTMTQNAFTPQAYGPNIQGVPNAQPATIPPYVGGSFGAAQAQANGGSFGTDTEIAGYGTAGQNGMATQAARVSATHWRDGPVLPAIGALLIGLVGLRAVHWRHS